jgi:hypothetical protein
LPHRFEVTARAKGHTLGYQPVATSEILEFVEKIHHHINLFDDLAKETKAELAELLRKQTEVHLATLPPEGSNRA